MARNPDEDSTPLKLVWKGDQLELWLEEPSKDRLSSLFSLLSHWGFPPDYKLRPATEAEVRGLEDMMPAVGGMMRKRGLAVYESPLRIHRGGDGVHGRAFDALRVELSHAGAAVNSQQLREILQKARLRNLPPGASARDYFA